MVLHWKKGVRLAVVAILAACSADPTVTSSTAPTAVPQASVQSILGPSPIGVLTAMRPLTRKAPLARDVSASAIIGAGGGTLRLPQVGFTLIVPRGAVGVPTAFSVTALAGVEVAYEFEPHGTVFLRPLTATQELRGTRHTLLQTPLKAGYFPDRATLSISGAGTMVSEQIAGLVDLRRSSFTWPIEHFSGYIVAW